MRCQSCSVTAYFKDKPKKSVEEKAEYQKAYYQNNKEHLGGYYSDYRAKIKIEMVEAYGGECKECGEVDSIVLNLDHIEDNGAVERRDSGIKGGFKFYMQLRKQGWPQEGYQLLCCNCNYRKEYYRRRDAIDFFKAG